MVRRTGRDHEPGEGVLPARRVDRGRVAAVRDRVGGTADIAEDGVGRDAADRDRQRSVGILGSDLAELRQHDRERDRVAGGAGTDMEIADEGLGVVAGRSGSQRPRGAVESDQSRIADAGVGAVARHDRQRAGEQILHEDFLAAAARTRNLEEKMDAVEELYVLCLMGIAGEDDEAAVRAHRWRGEGRPTGIEERVPARVRRNERIPAGRDVVDVNPDEVQAVGGW